ncbi:MAG: cytochrome c oxidase accessory protein CcoG [Alphaproteobacteria bacterium]|nr:cytochrome c oxidase accessory protein CcoG [Alphaproteobacteria bacterium]
MSKQSGCGKEKGVDPGLRRDDEIQLFAKQKKIYPRRVWGVFRKLKWVAMIALLGIYYLAPWLRWDRGAHAPSQAILIDMPNTRAYFFGIEIWPQEVYYITGLLILAAVGLFFITSLLGRVWCGYACPQTVWTDLFVWVERIIQGDRNARKKLDESPLSLRKIWLKSVTHFIWLVIGLCTGGAWVFYFNDAPTLLDQIVHFDVPWTVGGWILGLTFSTYLMAGYAREQICTYVCPYSRFQSAMFDKDTLIIAYDEKRGEQRGKHKAGDSWEGRGHCIDCDSCVVVCPMGIDIREGLQMECIACGLCVDACDNVMEKIGLPKGLIRYDTAHARESGTKAKLRLLRPRTFWYAGILSLVGGLMLYTLLTRSAVDLNVLHDRNPLFVKLSDGTIRNGYAVSILNKAHEDKNYRLSIEGLDGATVHIQQNHDVDPNDMQVFADSVGHFRVFVTAKQQDAHRKEILFKIQENSSNLTDTRDTIFVSEGK